MANAARIGDSSNHPGVISGPGINTVLIGNKPAAVTGDTHTCFRPTQNGTHPATPIINGSSNVQIGGRPAARLGDSIACGASIVTGEATVQIGG